jgi:UDP-N-acetylglucosamine acyltransferase
MNSNVIHPTSIIEYGAIIGENNYIGPYCYITSNSTIGNDNRLEAFVCVGTPAEHKNILRLGQQGKKTQIGNNNIFREYVTVHAGAFEDTIIGNDNILQRNAHIGHDAIIKDKVTLSCNTIVAGHVIVNDGSNMGLSSITHQFTSLPPYSMLGMGAILTKKTIMEPFSIYVGNPSRFLKVNKIGIERNGLTKEYISNVIKEWEMTHSLESTIKKDVL